MCKINISFGQFVNVDYIILSRKQNIEKYLYVNK